MRGQLAWVKEGAGALADGAILFPILFLLISRCGFAAPQVWLSAGLIYLVAGIYFRIPMPVQPLKSLALAAIALEATQKEVRLAAAVVAGVCLLLSILKVEKITQKVPSSLVHGIQLGLGVLLLGQGYKLGIQQGWEFLSFLGVAGLGLLAVNVSSGVPVLGILAVVALLCGIYEGWGQPTVQVIREKVELAPSFSVLAALVLPQLPLTLANSVIGTTDVAHRYFGARARKVTPRALLVSIGVGNILTAAFGGIPFCHGAGGVTAHYQGGARTYFSNIMIGMFLVFLGLLSFFRPLHFQYPVFLWVSLLAVIGIFHLKLAAPTWATNGGKVKLLMLAAVAAVSANMLWVVTVGLGMELVMELMGLAMGMGMGMRGKAWTQLFQRSGRAPTERGPETR